MVHFQPVGLAVWTTVYWMSLCSIGNSKMAAKTRQGLAGVRTASPLIRRSRCRPFMAPVRSAATSGDRNGSGDIAVDAAEFTPTRFDKRNAHLLAALQTRRRWRVLACDASRKNGGSVTDLSVTGCRRWAMITHHVPFPEIKPVNSVPQTRAATAKRPEITMSGSRHT
jgi:hypothetical protein